jgi:hypothetical protein
MCLPWRTAAQASESCKLRRMSESAAIDPALLLLVDRRQQQRASHAAALRLCSPIIHHGHGGRVRRSSPGVQRQLEGSLRLAQAPPRTHQAAPADHPSHKNPHGSRTSVEHHPVHQLRIDGSCTPVACGSCGAAAMQARPLSRSTGAGFRGPALRDAYRPGCAQVLDQEPVRIPCHADQFGRLMPHQTARAVPGGYSAPCSRPCPGSRACSAPSRRSNVSSLVTRETPPMGVREFPGEQRTWLPADGHAELLQAIRPAAQRERQARNDALFAAPDLLVWRIADHPAVAMSSCCISWNCSIRGTSTRNHPGGPALLVLS